MAAYYVADLGELPLEHVLCQLSDGGDQLLRRVVLVHDGARRAKRFAPGLVATEKSPTDVRFAAQPVCELDAAAVDELDVDDADGKGPQPRTLSRFCARQCQGHVEPSPIEGELYGTRGFGVHDD